MNKYLIISIILILISFGLAIGFYNSMPDEMAGHWNAQGEVDGNISKFWGLFLMPIISIIILFLFLIIPLIDPLKRNVDSFKNYYYMFVAFLLFFFLYIYLLTLLWNFGYIFNMTVGMMLALSALFYFLGFILSKSKRNWFMGIRTPWTLSSDEVWEKTHKLGSLLFKLTSLIIIIGLFFQNYIIWFVLVPIVIVLIVLVSYSYIIYKKLQLK
jgi:uncharacterized membrane protein